MIDLINLSKTYTTGIKALDDINLHINKGEIFGVIGSSGAGKSTLIRSVNLLEQPDGGKIIVDNQDLTQLSTSDLRITRKKIGMIFQHFNLLSSCTVFDNIALPLKMNRLKKTQIQQIVYPLLELTGLTNKERFYPTQLSGGQKQRVAIARALVNKPHVLLSDEATSALDPQTTHSILQLLKDINHKLGVTILLITHEMDVVKEACHRLAILEHGKVIEQANVLEFFCNPKTEIAKQFIRSHLKHTLPESIQTRLVSERAKNSNLLVRFSFLGKSAQEPLISNLVCNFKFEINILQANIELIRDETVGVMVVEISGNEEKFAEGIQYLTNKGVNVEIIGYVKCND